MLMAPTQAQRLAFRERFRSLHHEAFQAWFEQLAKVLFPAGDFQRIRRTQGDGGLDGLVISAGHVYQVYAPARLEELRDAQVAKKIGADFAAAHAFLAARLRAWSFVHNHPQAAIGKRTVKVVQSLRAEHPEIDLRILDIDSLWDDLLAALPDDSLERLFPQERINQDRHVNTARTEEAALVPDPDLAAATVFVGRDAELKALAEHLVQLRRRGRWCARSWGWRASASPIW